MGSRPQVDLQAVSLQRSAMSQRERSEPRVAWTWLR